MKKGEISHAIIAITGKGGVGKTTITYFLAEEFIVRQIHPLLIDADPTTSHLARLLGIAPVTTIEHLRNELIGVAARGDEQERHSLPRIWTTLSPKASSGRPTLTCS